MGYKEAKSYTGGPRALGLLENSVLNLNPVATVCGLPQSSYQGQHTFPFLLFSEELFCF